MQRHGRAIRFAAIAIAVAAWTAGSRAGYDDPILIEKSTAREKIASRIVTGTIMSYRPEAEGTGKPCGLRRYVAEIRVTTVEKGADIRPGETIHVGFSSHLTPEKLDTERPLSGCGEYKVDPFTTELARVYMTLDPSRGLVADHPADFFAIANFVPWDLVANYRDRAREIERRRVEKASKGRRELATVVVILAIPAGLVLGSLGLHAWAHRREFPTKDVW